MKIYSQRNAVLVSVVLALLLSGCSGNSNKKRDKQNAPTSSSSTQSSRLSSSENSNSSSSVADISQPWVNEPIAKASSGEAPQWKRVKAIKSDLAYALDLPDDQLCAELGSLPCFDQVHLSALGGNEPFVITQYEPVAVPTAISAVAAERVALAACSNKVNMDANGTATLFTHLDLDTVAEPESADYLSALEKQNRVLYQRLLARDPSEQELSILEKLTSDEQGQALSNSDIAKLSCFIIATSSEFIFL